MRRTVLVCVLALGTALAASLSQDRPEPTVSVPEDQLTLVHHVPPEYPAEAQRIRLQGVVTLNTWVNEQGTVEWLKVQTGHPMLCESAVTAVKQWVYKPWLVDNTPTRVKTLITVRFNRSD